jgi:methylated-DNA-protein-cysteine methyltransferase related protein
VKLYLTALKFVSPDANPPVPWQRVVSSTGAISSRGPETSGALHQRRALEAEGVEVTGDGDGRVSLASYGWFPEVGTIDTGVLSDEDTEAQA